MGCQCVSLRGHDVGSACGQHIHKLAQAQALYVRVSGAAPMRAGSSVQAIEGKEGEVMQAGRQLFGMSPA